MIKKYKEQFQLIIKTKQSNISSPIGPMLGQRGINMMEFSKEFNSLTRHFKENLPIPVSVILNKNRTFKINTQIPLSSFILKRLANIEKGSSNTKNNIVSSINIKHLYEFVDVVIKSHQQQYCKILIATAKSMGIHIIY